MDSWRIRSMLCISAMSGPCSGYCLPALLPQGLHLAHASGEPRAAPPMWTESGTGMTGTGSRLTRSRRRAAAPGTHAAA